MAFEKGKSGNPGGRPRDVLGLTEYARNLCPRVFDALINIVEDESNKLEGRVKAGNIIVERGMGSLISSATLIPGHGTTVEGQLADTAGRVQLEAYYRAQQINKDV